MVTDFQIARIAIFAILAPMILIYAGWFEEEVFLPLYHFTYPTNKFAIASTLISK